jgi:hypothetical protein
MDRYAADAAGDGDEGAGGEDTTRTNSNSHTNTEHERFAALPPSLSTAGGSRLPGPCASLSLHCSSALALPFVVRSTLFLHCSSHLTERIIVSIFFLR